MRYKITLQKRDGSWVYVIAFGKDTPTEIEHIAGYSDNCVSAEDGLGIRHHVYSKNGKIVQIQLHEARRILPQLDPERPESIRMPAMRAIMFGQTPVPTLLLSFKETPPDTRVLYALSPNVFLAFQDDELAQLYVTDVYTVIADVA
jgi:hypothetical protein